jgi:hypothetical protein
LKAEMSWYSVRVCVRACVRAVSGIGRVGTELIKINTELPIINTVEDLCVKQRLCKS